MWSRGENVQKLGKNSWKIAQSCNEDEAAWVTFYEIGKMHFVAIFSGGLYPVLSQNDDRLVWPIPWKWRTSVVSGIKSDFSGRRCSSHHGVHCFCYAPRGICHRDARNPERGELLGIQYSITVYRPKYVGFHVTDGLSFLLSPKSWIFRDSRLSPAFCSACSSEEAL